VGYANSDPLLVCNSVNRTTVLVYTGSKTRQRDLLHKSLHFVNFAGLPIQWHTRFKLASLTLTLNAMHTGLKPHLTYSLPSFPCSQLIFLSSNFLQGPRTDLNFGSRSVRAAVQLFRTPLQTESVYLTHLILSSGTLSHTFPSSFQFPCRQIQALPSIHVTNDALCCTVLTN